MSSGQRRSLDGLQVIDGIREEGRVFEGCGNELFPGHIDGDAGLDIYLLRVVST
jgi:hypothetical protein